MSVCVCVYTVFFIHSSVNGHLVCFHVVTIINKAAMNMGVQINPQDSDFISLR